jgi:DNA-binding response OmpR family regulator
MVLEAITAILSDMGHQVDGFTDSQEGEDAALSAEYDLVLIDLRMPGKDGATVTEGILAAKPAAKVLVITGHPTDPLAKRALDAGAKGLLKKPFEIGKVLDHLSE